MSELLEAIKSASPEQVVVAFGAAMEAAYVSHPRDGAAAAVASIAAQHEAQAKADADAAAEAAKAEAEAAALAAESEPAVSPPPPAAAGPAAEPAADVPEVLA